MGHGVAAAGKFILQAARAGSAAAVKQEQDFLPGDTVRLVGGNPAHLMTVRAASPFTVLCASAGPAGTVQYEPYPPEALELVARGDQAAR